MAVVGSVLRQASDDAFDMQADEVVDGFHLCITLLVGIGADDGVALLGSLFLDAIEHGSIVMSHEIRHNDTYHMRCLLTKTLSKRIGPIVETPGQFFHSLLHLLTNLRGTAQGSADGGDTHAQLLGEVLQ